MTWTQWYQLLCHYADKLGVEDIETHEIAYARQAYDKNSSAKAVAQELWGRQSNSAA